MCSVRPIFWFTLATLILWVSAISADTNVHGIIIPTTESSVPPTIKICGSLASQSIDGGIQRRFAKRSMSGTDSRTYSAHYCLPSTYDTGPRYVDAPVIIPLVIAEAIEQVELDLVTFFDHDSYDMNDIESTDAIDTLINWVNANPNVGLNIEGHTDSTGDTRYNEILSFRRAESVKVLLVEQGIEPHRIKTFGFGETNLLVSITGRERQNRRVEIEVFQMKEIAPLPFPLPENW